VTTEENRRQQRGWHILNKKQKKWLLSGSIALAAGLIIAPLQSTQTRQSAALILSQPSLGALPIVPDNLRWNFAINQFHLVETQLKSGDVLGKILNEQGLSSKEIMELVQNSDKAGFSITRMRIGKNLNFLTQKNATKAGFMVYEPSPYEYIVFSLNAPFEVKIIKRDVETRMVTSAGVLESSFWQALVDNDLSDELADGMIDVLASSVDFYHQKQGDRFKVMYEQHFVEGRAVGTGKIIAAVYERDGKEFHAFNFDKEGLSCKYYDFDGRPARKAFLKAPVKFSRISSRYDLNRLHPVLGYHKAHFGTDYAAPYGTPILAVADGVVEEAARRGGNGNFVKLRHDKTYETQYLHMQGFAKGIRAGAHVAQGQTIGYVGSTGLATGPHVCFRFWKNGQQVDHLRLNLPSPEPIKGDDLKQYETVRNNLKMQLDAVPYRTSAEIAKAKNVVP
jgi:murein DD-endopeptidase MepM/ murein hydrolase activator NlpD